MDVNELHRGFRKTTKFRRVYSKGLDDTWSMDLVFMRNAITREKLDDDDFKKITKAQLANMVQLNNGYEYFLTVIDLFSRYGWAVPLKSKSAAEVWSALESIIKSGRKPRRIWTDQGSEFWNRDWKQKLENIGIELYYTGDDKKAVVVERFNKTIKTWMWQEFTRNGNLKWVSLLPGIVKHYNSKLHSSIGMSPKEAVKHPEDIEQPPLTPLVTPKYKLNSWVRILRTKNRFEKGFTQNWSDEIFKIVRIDLNSPAMYHVQDERGDDVVGGFYEREVQPTSKKPTFVWELSNSFPVNGHRQTGNGIFDYDLHVKENGVWKWIPLSKFVTKRLPSKQNKKEIQFRDEYDFHDVAKYIHDHLPVVWQYG